VSWDIDFKMQLEKNTIKAIIQLFSAIYNQIMANIINYNTIDLLRLAGELGEGGKATICCLKPDNSCLWTDEFVWINSVRAEKQLFTASTSVIVAFGPMGRSGCGRRGVEGNYSPPQLR
jgi:hypothetical protein